MTKPFADRSPGSVVAEVVMTRAAMPGANLLLEGPSDSHFWRAHTDCTSCHIVICHGKKTVTKSLSMLEDMGIKCAVGIVDDDLDSVFGILQPSANVAVTDSHDLEALLLASPALEKVIAEFADLASEFETADGRTVREALIERAVPFGKLRYLAAMKRLPVGFEALYPPNFIDPDNWKLDVDQLIASFAKLGGLNADDVTSLLNELPDVPVWSLIHGHDAESILHCGLRKVLSSRNCSREQLSSALRIAFDRSLLRKTNLWSWISDWEIRAREVVLARVA